MTEIAGTPPASYNAAPDSLEQRLREALAPNLLLVREIGAGGMARVFLAREPALKRLVAVKVLSGELARTDAGRARFEREAQAVAGLSHPNIVAVHSVGELSDRTPYFVMQYVAGRSMSDRITQDGPLPIAEARRALGEVAAALAAAHKQGIIHRDVKPANVLYEDATGRVLVSDFGIAAIGREAAAPVNVKLTATGSILGTPQYMSPEQLLAEPVTEKTDVYSLGLLAHELLAGGPAFKGTSPHELIAAHLRDVPDKLSRRRPEVDAELEDVVARCLEKNAADRPTADEVARRLVPGAGALLEWPPPGLEQLHGRMRRVSMLFLLGGAGLTLAMFAMVAGGTRMSSVMVSPVSLLLLILSAAGIIGLGVAAARAIALATVASRAILGGYAWMTVLETMCDPRGDTGNIIAGSREYAGLSAAQRDYYRRARVWSELSLLAGGLLAPLLFLLALILGSTGVAGVSVAWVGVVVPAAGLLAAVVLAERERRAFAAHRGRRTANVDVTRLASSWYETFETVRRGQKVGRGRAASPRLGRNTAIVVAVALGLVVLLLIPLAVVGTLGPSFWSATLPRFANTKEKARIGEVARPHVLPRDPRITPQQAGRAFFVLHPSRVPNPLFPENPRDTLPSAPWSEKLPDGLFTAARFDASENVPSPLKVLAVARGGLTPAERRYLARLAAAPQWPLWDTIARAQSMDHMGARFRLPFGPGATPWALPLPTFSTTKMLAYASVSRAAHHLAEGRRDSAETVLRGTISVGFLMNDQANTLIEQLIGIVITGIGRQALIDYYKAIGDPRGAMLQARVDSAVARSEAGTRIEAPNSFSGIDVRDAHALRAAVGQIAADRHESRGLRIEMLGMLGIAPCTNLRELVFGPDPELRALYDRQRAALGRFASDTAVIDMMERSAELLSPRDIDERSRFVRGAATAAGAILRNKRLPGCVTLLTAVN